MYDFVVIDPRANEETERMFQNPVYGVEITIPALAERCVWNLDHHGVNVGLPPAIEQALTCKLPPEGATIATIRPDLDSVGSMAVMARRAEWDEGRPVTGLGDWETNLSLDLHWSETMFQTLAFRDRVLKVATADAGATAGEWRPLNLPSRSTPWPEAVAASDRQDLSAIALAVSDYKVPLVERVEWMRQWLLSGAEPEGYRDKANSDRQGLIKALEDGTIKVTHDGGCVAVVESSHRSAMTIGYSLAPVVVAINPTFSFAGNPPVRKITICQYSAGYVDLQAVFAALSNLEPGWGGTDTIGGSPQGAASVLSAEEIIAAVTTATRATVG